MQEEAEPLQLSSEHRDLLASNKCLLFATEIVFVPYNMVKLGNVPFLPINFFDILLKVV